MNNESKELIKADKSLIEFVNKVSECFVNSRVAFTYKDLYVDAIKQFSNQLEATENGSLESIIRFGCYITKSEAMVNPILTEKLAPIYATIELVFREKYPQNTIKNAVSLLYGHPAKSRHKKIQYLKEDMRNNALDANFSATETLDGDAMHVLLYLVHEANEFGVEERHRIRIETTLRQILKGLNWCIGGEQGERLYEMLNKLSDNKYLIKQAKGKKGGKKRGNFLSYAPDGLHEGKLLIHIDKNIVKIVTKQYYSISLSLLNSLEVNIKNLTTNVNPLDQLFTRRVRRMIKALYIHFKVQGNFHKTESWEYFLHSTGEFIDDMNNRKKVNRIKRDLNIALAFLKTIGQICLEKNPKLTCIKAGKSERLKETEFHLFNISKRVKKVE